MSIWWEKTVEYKFVVEYVAKFSIKPLSGREEKAIGDAIVESATGFKIIEFKRYKKSLCEENDKYKDLPEGENYQIYVEKAIKELDFYANKFAIPHYFIYGISPNISPPPRGSQKIYDISSLKRRRHPEIHAENQAKRARIAFPELEIECCNYWTHIPLSPSDLDAAPAFKNATDLVKYISNIAEIRNSEEESGAWRNSLAIFECFNEKYFGLLNDIFPLIQRSIINPRNRGSSPALQQRAIPEEEESDGYNK